MPIKIVKASISFLTRTHTEENIAINTQLFLLIVNIYFDMEKNDGALNFPSLRKRKKDRN